eukprot:767108-Hanusia_phi.AAC.2
MTATSSILLIYVGVTTPVGSGREQKRQQRREERREPGLDYFPTGHDRVLLEAGGLLEDADPGHGYGG